MGCVCCSLSSFVSIILNALERITLCTVCAALVCCLLFTVISVMVMGIGIGFHYCTVQNSVDAMENAAQAAGALRSGGPVERPMMRSVNKAVKRGFAHRLSKRDQADLKMPSNNNTINDIILSGRHNNTLNDLPLNYTVTSHKVKRDLAAMKTSDMATDNIINDTFLFNILNDTLSPESIDDAIIFKNLNSTVEDPLHNNTIYNAILLRQNCTLLNFLTRFF